LIVYQTRFRFHSQITVRKVSSPIYWPQRAPTICQDDLSYKSIGRI